jgi:sugar-phosphatase
MTFVLADLDGTLVDSGAAVERAWAWWAERRGVDPAALEGLKHGIPGRQVVEQVAPHLDAGAEATELDAFQARDTEGVMALPGAADLFARFGDGRLAIVTSGTTPLARSRLRAAGLPEPRVLITPERLQRGKPDPEGYLLGARELGAAVAECIVLEDAPAGVAAGRAAGARVVAVLTTHSAEELAAADEIAPDVRTWLHRST